MFTPFLVKMAPGGKKTPKKLWLLLNQTSVGEFYWNWANDTRQTKAYFNRTIDEAESGGATRWTQESLVLIPSFSEASREHNVVCKFK